jgi:hypothetical protein
LALLNVALFVFTLFAIGHWSVPSADAVQALMWVSGVVGVAIAGDTWRPSGLLRVTNAIDTNKPTA